MAETHYCWRCQIEVPLLDESEWAVIEPLLRSAIREHRKDWWGRTHAELAEALARNEGLPVLQKYLELTGFMETNINAIWHHRRSRFGEPCPQCGRLLRTPRARLCVECGYTKDP